MSQLCVHCDFDTIFDMCGIVTPLNQLGFPQCLRCLQPLENNMACGCSPCPDCLIYLPVGKVHRCTKMRNICIDCNNVIISFSKSCLYCVTNKKKNICDQCPLSFQGKLPVLCQCNNIVGGQANYEKMILKYSFGCNKSLMDIYLNTNQDEIHFPHEFLEAYKH